MEKIASINSNRSSSARFACKELLHLMLAKILFNISISPSQIPVSQLFRGGVGLYLFYSYELSTYPVETFYYATALCWAGFLYTVGIVA